MALIPRMVGIEHSWRMRWPFVLVVAVLAFGATSAWFVRRNDSARSEYEGIATQFEDPFLPPGFDGNMFGGHTDLPGSQRQIDWADGWRSVGPVQDGLETGTWSIIAPDGSVRARFEMRGGQREGSCEFQDATGARRVHGEYRASHRVGVWTLEHVLGAGTTRVYFGP